MLKEKVSSANAPVAIGPYSPAIKLGDFVYVSGQIPVDPKTNEVVSQDIAVQTEQVFANIKAILAEMGLTTDHIVKTTVFLTDMNDFAAMNEVYGKHFVDPYPARSTVAVVALPKGVKVEVECLVIDTLVYEQSSCSGCSGDCDGGCC